jgi:hypothetical protein
MSIRRDLLLRTALLRLPDLVAMRAMAPAGLRAAVPTAGGAMQAAPPSRPAPVARRPAARKPPPKG